MRWAPTLFILCCFSYYKWYIVHNFFSFFFFMDFLARGTGTLRLSTFSSHPQPRARTFYDTHRQSTMNRTDLWDIITNEGILDHKASNSEEIFFWFNRVYDVKYKTSKWWFNGWFKCSNPLISCFGAICSPMQANISWYMHSLS